MKAIHGGKAKNDKVDSHKIASLIRGGTFPMAFVYPRDMRSTSMMNNCLGLNGISKNMPKLMTIKVTCC